MKKIIVVCLGIFLFVGLPLENVIAQERPYTFEPTPCPFEGTDFGLVVVST